MSARPFDQRHQELATRLDVKPEQLESMREGGLPSIAEREAAPTLRLGPWMGAKLWEDGVVSQDEARYLDGLRIQRNSRKVRRWREVLQSGDVPSELQNATEWDESDGALVPFDTICSCLEAETVKARTFVSELLDSLGLEVQETELAGQSRPTEAVRFPPRATTTS